MGVQGLWELVKEGSENVALQTLMVREGFEAKQDWLYVIGVDVSIWMRQFEHKFSVGHVQTGENPELRTFLFRLSTLANYPVHLVFVADGPLRPKTKRGTQVKMAPPWLTEGMRNLAEAFGFGWIQAAGEAEAELAEMNRLGHIDAVMTDDGDALLFGANVVIRNCELKRSETHSVEVYCANAIAMRAKLSRPDLLLYALLVGCDYDSTGLDRCGDQTAHGLIRYGVAQMLFEVLAAHKDDDDELHRALEDWRDHVRASLCTDPMGFIGRTNRMLAARVSSSFPNIHVLHSFLSPPLLPASSYSAALSPRFIDFARLGALCELHFGWGNRPQLLQKCRNLFWSNEVVRMLVVEGLRREEHVEHVPAAHRLVGVAVEDVDEPPAFGYARCRVRIFDDGIGDAITSALRRLREYHATEKAPQEQVLIEAGRSATFRLLSQPKDCATKQTKMGAY